MHYSPDHPDPIGAEKGPIVERREPSGRPTYNGTPERLIAERGTPDTVPHRNRKGRSTYEVRRGHIRYLTGPDPFRGEDWEGLRSDRPLVRADHRTLVDWADAWMREHAPAEACTCDDLTATVLVLDRKTRLPIWDTAAQRYVTAVRHVRRCHCGWPALLGQDGGKRTSWSERTPATIATGERLSTTRLRGVRRRSSDRWTSITDAEGAHLYWVVIGPDGVQRIVAPTGERDAVWIGHERVERRAVRRSDPNKARAVRRAKARATAPVPDWQPEADTLAAALRDSDASDVQVSFPGVTVSIRRSGGPVWTATIVRDGAEPVRIRTRTVGPIARAVVA